MSDANEAESSDESDANEAGSSDESGRVETGPSDTADRVETLPGRPCPICERSMAHRHCKYVCPEHGVIYDCSDTFW